MGRQAIDDTTETRATIANALDLLTRDHLIVEQLFAAFEAAAGLQLEPLARRICKLLRVHAQIEEEIFYPWARRVLGDDGLLDLAQQDHAEANRLILRLESMTAEDADFRSTMSVLASRVADHVAEEEGQLFARVHRAGIDLIAMGIALAGRRDVLLEVLGLHNDDEAGGENQRLLQTASQQIETAEAARPDG